MNAQTALGIGIAAIGVVVLAVSQILLRVWIKKYNREWQGGMDKDEMS